MPTHNHVPRHRDSDVNDLRQFQRFVKHSRLRHARGNRPARAELHALRPPDARPAAPGDVHAVCDVCDGTGGD